MSTNLFEILAVGRKEAPHDRFLGWLLDPCGGHGLLDFAQTIVAQSFGEKFNEQVTNVKQQFNLADTRWPDIGVEFESALLIVENKVRAGALQAGQLADQHRLARARQKGRRLYHILLCPDRFPRQGLGLESPDFRILTYGQLAELLRAALPRTEPDTEVLLRHYVSFLESDLARAPLTGAKLASVERIIRQTGNDEWTEESFLKQAVELGGDRLVIAQQRVLELLRTLDGIDVEYGEGKKAGTYRVTLRRTDSNVLWVYADGRVYVRWGKLSRRGYPKAAAHWIGQWRGMLKSDPGDDGAFLNERLEVIDADEFATRLIALIDAARGESSSPR